MLVCECRPDTIRIEADIRASFIENHFEHFKTDIIPQLGQFGKIFFAGQIHSGFPEPVKNCNRASALLDVICNVEGLAMGSFQFMMDQFMRKEGMCKDIIIEVVK